MVQASPTNDPMPWSKEDALRALNLFNKKHYSYGSLAAEFGRSRSSIAGLISRFRAKGLVTPTLKRPTKKKKRIKNADPIVVALVKNAAALQLKERRVRLRLIESDTEVTFAELQPYHCRFPFGDPKRSDFRFCGRPKCDEAPYCEDHCAMVYAPPPQRRR